MYVNLETLESIDRSQLQTLFPDTSFPPDIAADNIVDLGYTILEMDPAPEKTANQAVENGPIRREGNRVIQGWKVRKLTKAEIAARDTQVQAQTMAAFEQAVQGKLNSAAIAARYDSIATAVSYAEEPAVPKFQKDGIAFRAWRSKVWAYAYEQLALVLAGGREQPTVDEFLLELPQLELPA